MGTLNKHLFATKKQLLVKKCEVGLGLFLDYGFSHEKLITNNYQPWSMGLILGMNKDLNKITC